ncbi:hypothetical protein GOFOIKOB_5832 [Methylobacterium tardum]|uniref:Uncharacterized protein n=1 Tax=Methylobacterium tardum TaxID=374432 RepID=A0AA37TDZ3_9HYPH|nr:hypothetical protein [Methylobacterium tardum]URD39503.1 hypothetical protein M6G65_14505 [Methylobacterium tardum]GJE52758.1 hypothetical protein GOFOIKOB_5832 [Methylobacterium tardum]GLS68252.1 hypothetical protein GCM10007890_02640 [Methylobacterium tardum]
MPTLSDRGPRPPERRGGAPGSSGPALKRRVAPVRVEAAVHPVVVLAAAAVGAGLLTWFASGREKRLDPAGSDGRRYAPRGRAVTASAAQRLNHASTMLAASVLFDSGLEHYRGQFFNRAMYTPIIVSSVTLAASLHGAGDTDPGSSRVRHGVQVLAGLTGLIGFGFHAYNVGKREGGYSFQNLFYSAPIGAPMALTLAGILGGVAERVRDADPDQPQLGGLPAGRALALATAGMLAGTTLEAGLLHFRGAFQNPAMYIPVSLPPLAAALLVRAATRPVGARQTGARLGMWAVSAMGVGGVAFHAYGVARMMGGWDNWRQNLIDGPPLPAPPSFSGVALGGLAALELLEHRPFRF